VRDIADAWVLVQKGMKVSIGLQLRLEGDASFAAEAVRALRSAHIETHMTPRMRGVSPIEVIVTLGSAGAFTAVYKVISKLLDRNKDREVTMKRGEMEVCVKGYNLPETNELLDRLAPELLKKKRRRK
jgi:hypothetical protein